MKSLKVNWLTFSVVVIAFALFCYIYWCQKNTANSVVTASSRDIAQQVPDAKELVIHDKTLKAQNDTTLSAANEKPSQLQVGKKNYDDNWCDARNELNESDYHFAKNEHNDWLITIGKARVGNPQTSRFNESAYPNSSLIQSYEPLPLEQLRSLAFQGDKWAMVTFVQNLKASDEAKDQIAKKLMVNGASYYALGHFVRNALVKAQLSAEKKHGIETTKDYVTDALAYAYWGLQYYNDGGLEPFLAIAFSERNRAQMPIDSILVDSVDEVNEKLSKLNQWVNEQRVAQGIEMPMPPKSVPNFFAFKIAASESIAPERFTLLRRLDITNSNHIASTPCVETFLAEISARSQ